MCFDMCLPEKAIGHLDPSAVCMQLRSGAANALRVHPDGSRFQLCRTGLPVMQAGETWSTMNLVFYLSCSFIYVMR